jgi:hypothetical protein
VAASAELRLGDGCIAPLDPRVWSFSVSGWPVVGSWLRYRLGGAKRAGSPLDDIRPTWTADLTAELLELLWLLDATLDWYPALAALLDEVVAEAG